MNSAGAGKRSSTHMHHKQDGRKGKNSDDRIAVNVIIDALDSISISMFVPWTARSDPPLTFICNGHGMHISAEGVSRIIVGHSISMSVQHTNSIQSAVAQP